MYISYLKLNVISFSNKLFLQSLEPRMNFNGNRSFRPLVSHLALVTYPPVFESFSALQM